MKIKYLRIFYMLSIILLFSFSGFLCGTFGKYVTRIPVGTCDLTIIPAGTTNRVYLIGGEKFNQLISKRATAIKFGTYTDYPQFKDSLDGINAAVDGNNVESDTIKIFYQNSTIYVLSENIIYSNPDSSGMFRNMKNLNSIEFNNYSTEDVVSTSGMFSGCERLRNLDISCFDTKNVTDMSLMFHNCESLTVIYASKNFVTQNVTNGANMFLGCESLRGGRGTSYRSLPRRSRSSYIYAKIDERFAPGYFTSAD